ncbi:bifunctional YncE family protein/alkaline phosphatase family protein [Solihabitans fulvus]|uniref:Bifunctional YncE family protein/alkaline phosphatase family protein n=1 Tax=Solihabitans fulvus TaxID=1892852 RepID=A0A5B2XDY5_9PSEU|nr:bifunctional YncE family protein/alkaline phosphatase family protein [Solihabitans fulvus]
MTPAGHQTNLSDLPLNAVASPDGRWLAVTNDGQGTQALQLVDTGSGAVVQTIQYASPQALFVGLAFSRDGRTLYASAGGNNKIRTYAVGDAGLTETAPIPLPTRSESGKALNPYPAGIALTPDGGRLLVADRLADAVTSIDLRSGQQQTTGVGHAPYSVVPSPDGTRAWVTEQGSNTVSVLDIGGGSLRPVGQVTVGTHPNRAVLDGAGRRLYVANGDSDEVSVLDTAAGRVVRTISLAPYRGAPVGSNPDAVALSTDQRTLYVANSGNNDIAVVDIDSGSVRGLVPTAWYPTAVVPVGALLFVTNAKGLGAGPNDGPGHPNPESPAPTSPSQYVGSMMVGTLSVIPRPDDRARLRDWTDQVRDNDGFDEHGERHAAQDASAVVPQHPGQSSPIRHVIYVVKENRTYDQEFGSLGRGDGSPALNLFGDESAPNARALARQYVTLDNFYADAEVSAQGWNWSVAANSNPYAEQGWPANYSGRNHPYPSESGEPAIAPNRDPANAYIWDRLAGAGISFRNYGFYVNGGANGYTAADPLLDANTDHAYRGFDLNCPDSAGTFTAVASCGTPRIDEWLKEFQGYQDNGNLPSVEFLRLPNDHTAGTYKGAPTPTAYVADNDLALGRLVDAVSHSAFWSSTAIFVTEDDAQNGADHVDAHRTLAEVISPYTRTGRVDSTFYSTASMLRTIELLVGIGPMTQFDAYAAPLARPFTWRPDTRPYTARTPSTPLNERNTAASPLAALSAAQNLTVEDAIDEQTFNRAIWASVRGADSPMPAARHSLRSSGNAGDPGQTAQQPKDDD